MGSQLYIMHGIQFSELKNTWQGKEDGWMDGRFLPTVFFKGQKDEKTSIFSVTFNVPQILNNTALIDLF